MLARLDTIQSTIAERQTHRDEDTRSDTPPPLFLKPLTPLIRRITPALIRFGKQVERKFDFYVDGTCVGCGVCAQVCLANRIQLVDGKPQWPASTACYGCFSCLNYCPRHAVQIRSSWYLKSHTSENGRYHHPQVTARDIAAQKAAGRIVCQQAVMQGATSSQ
jgi:formate hydrogenlyase subunit 6/NADH:ubiquinone oxidoreductase subunit I